MGVAAVDEDELAAWTEQQRKKLDVLSKHVHSALRMLKIGDTGTISCGKKFPLAEVRPYVIAYAFHKRKWFELKHDVVSDTLQATRVKVPSFLPVVEPDEPEEP
jgi:hypothetical protein